MKTARDFFNVIFKSEDLILLQKLLNCDTCSESEIIITFKEKSDNFFQFSNKKFTYEQILRKIIDGFACHSANGNETIKNLETIIKHSVLKNNEIETYIDTNFKIEQYNKPIIDIIKDVIIYIRYLKSKNED